MAWFPGDDPCTARPFHPAALPAHDSAFAMIVHKAQGSEFGEVWLVVPERYKRALSKDGTSMRYLDQWGARGSR